MKKGALFCLKGFTREPKPPQKGNKGTTGHPRGSKACEVCLVHAWPTAQHTHAGSCSPTAHDADTEISKDEKSGGC